MRRLIAYILTCVGILLGVTFNLTTALNETNPNYEYDTGREYTYRIAYKNEDTANEIGASIQKEVRETMEERLSLYGVTKYQIAEEGNDILRVKFKQNNTTEYTRVAAFLSYDADFTVAIGDPDKSLTAAGDDLFTSARIGYIQKSSIPVVLIDLKDADAISELEKIVEEAIEIQDKKGTAGEDGGESSLTDEATIVIWSDYDPDTDDFIKGKSGEDSESQAKIFMTFDPRHIWYDNAATEHGTIALYLNIGEVDETTGRYDSAKIAQANKDALYLKNIFNASSFNENIDDEAEHFKVDVLFYNIVEPSIEHLFNFDIPLTVEISKTLIAITIGLIVIMLVLIALNRLAALHMGVTSLLTTFLTLVFYNIIGIEFSSSTVVGLIVVFLVSLSATLIHYYAFKNEVYRGRTMKKANQEAAKKTNAAITDSFVVTLLIGIITYFLGGPALQGFATFTLLGSLVGFFISLLLNKGIFWLLANNVRTASNYKLFGINPEKVNPTFEKKAESYEGRIAALDTKKPAKWVGIGGGALAFTSLLLTIIFSFTSVNVVNRAIESDTYTRIYLTVNTDNTTISTVKEDAENEKPSRPSSILALITYEDEPLAYDSLEIEYNSVPEGEGLDKIYVKKTYFVMNFNLDLTPETLVTYNTVSMPLHEALSTVFEDSDPNAIVSVNPVKITSASPSINEIYLSAGISLVIIGVYLMIRYGLSKGLVYLGGGLVAGLITLGFFVITRIAVTPMALVSVILAINYSGVLVSYLFGYMKREKKDYPELSIIDANENGLRQVITPLTLISIITLVAALNLFGLGPNLSMFIYLGLIIAGAVSFALTIYIALPFEAGVRKFIAKLPKIERKKKTPTKKNIDKRRKSAEPEEAIIIGIND